MNLWGKPDNLGIAKTAYAARGSYNMKCPFCGHENTRVIDSRPAEENNSIRRRRVCDECEKRFTTYEKISSKRRLIYKSKNGKNLLIYNHLLVYLKFRLLQSIQRHFIEKSIFLQWEIDSTDDFHATSIKMYL